MYVVHHWDNSGYLKCRLEHEKDLGTSKWIKHLDFRLES